MSNRILNSKHIMWEGDELYRQNIVICQFEIFFAKCFVIEKRKREKGSDL